MKKLISLSAFCFVLACGQTQNTSAVKAEAGASADSIFLDEANYNADFDAKVLPLMATAETGTFQGTPDKGAPVELYYNILRNPEAKGKIIMVGGFTENVTKYRELIYNFYTAGYSIYIYDHRDQGKSHRFSKIGWDIKSPRNVSDLTGRQMVWVRNWSDYVNDLKTFVHTKVPKDGLPTFIYSHSMGAAIVSDALTDEPSLAAAAVIGSPIIKLKTDFGPFKGAFADFLAKGLAGIGSLVLDGKYYSPNQGPIDAKNSTTEASSTSSVNRHDRYLKDALADGEAQGGAAINWVQQVFVMNKKLENTAMIHKNVSTPILMGQAGLDALADPAGQNSYCGAAQHCELYKDAGSKHEIYNETPEHRNPWIEKMLGFYASHLND